MGLYVYKCRNCGKIYEVLKPMAERESDVCDVCGAEALLQVAQCGFVLYGDGFYENSEANKDGKKGPR